MVLDSGELERLAEQCLVDRIITMDLYCARCGYNLRMLPYLGRCPECGGEYNARPLRMEGIFNAQMLVFPTGDVAAAVFTWALAAVLIAAGVYSLDGWWLFFAVICAVLGFFFTRSAWNRATRFFQFRGIARRIASDWEE
jgi:hypothetical protein